MTKKELVSMARESGFLIDYYAQQYQPNCILSTHGLIDEPLQRFANLVVAHKAEPPPEWESIKNILDEYGLDAIAFVAEFKAAQQQAEPVAWMVYTKDGQSVYVTDNPTDIQEAQRALPLYTTPPDYERGFIDGMQKQMQSSVDKAVNAMTQPTYYIPNKDERTWVGLTDAEIWSAVDRIGTSDSDVNPYQILNNARAIEAKLKEKNT